MLQTGLIAHRCIATWPRTRRLGPRCQQSCWHVAMRSSPGPPLPPLDRRSKRSGTQ